MFLRRFCGASGIILVMQPPAWPDPLHPADPAQITLLLEHFWRTLAKLPDLLVRQELLLAAELTATLRRTVLELMLALNGITWPAGTAHLNSYLGAS